MLERDVCYRALCARDPRFDGRFYVCVRSTGIYCRPICPARTPKLENCVFVPTSAAAHQLGFRSCLRCRPELAPHLAAFRGTANTVSRALALIAEGALDEGDVEQLAARLGIGQRQLRRLFDQHVGASPISVAQAQRILFAKRLITETSLSMANVALGAGFGSIRRFNQVIRDTYGRAPLALRRSATSAAPGAGVTLRLPYRPPYDWTGMLAFLAARAIPGVELVDGARYLRTFALGGVQGMVEVTRAVGAHQLLATIHTEDVCVLGSVVARLKRVFDLDAEMEAIDAHLARDRRLEERVRARPGVRVPGAWDAFELAVRAVLGQQISVAAATTFAGRLVASHGRPLSDHVAPTLAAPRCLFPQPAELAEASLTRIGLTRARAQTLCALASAVHEEPQLLAPRATLEESVAKLVSLPGIGPWTAHYIALRALDEPDALPASDLGLLRALETAGDRPTPAELSRWAEAWRPWRSYAVIRLWTQPSSLPTSSSEPRRGAVRRTREPRAAARAPSQ